jgi:uncharacterized protein YecT (DUF1311 family)
VKPICLAALVALAVGAPAAAASLQDVQKRYTPAFDRCLNGPQGMSTIGQIDCIAEELKVQDARLNSIYAKAMAGLTPAQKDKLRTAQRTWLAFRDADCASLQDEEWGSISRVEANQCVLERTVERTLELETYPPQ